MDSSASVMASGVPEYVTTTVKSRPFFGRVDGCGSTTSFIGCVTAGFVLNCGVASTWLKAASRPSTFTLETSRPWKSRENCFRVCCALAWIVVLAELNVLVPGS